MVMFALRNLDHDAWSDRKQLDLEHTGKDGGPIETAEVGARELIERRLAGVAERLAADNKLN